MTRRNVILFGQSMLLSLIGASLESCADMQISQAETWDEINTMAAANLPDTLIFDLDAASISHIMTLLFINPCLQLIGLDVETNRALLVSGKETRTLTMNRVRDIILAQ
jgi:hypothetical protein